MKLYNNRLYADLVARLKGADKIDFIIVALTKFIQEDMEQTLSKVSQDIKDLNEARAAKVAPDQSTQNDDSWAYDGENLENLIKLISKDIQKVDATTEILGDYMNKDKNIHKLQDVLDILRKTFQDIFG